MILSKGQKADLTKGRSVKEITFALSWHSADSDIDINASAFLLGPGGKCARDEDFIFYGQQTSRQGAVVHAQTSREGGEEIRIRMADIPSDIEKIAITLTIHDGEIIGKAFGQVADAECSIRDSGTGEQLGLFRFGEGLRLETAIVVGEFYLHKGDWKFNAVGSGFNGGLPKLVTNFGLELDGEADAGFEDVEDYEGVEDYEDVVDYKDVEDYDEDDDDDDDFDFDEDYDEVAAAAAEPFIRPSEFVKPTASVQLGKINLEKKGSVNIRKAEKVTARLEWESDRDLDLYCFYVTKNGDQGKIYYRNLGSSQNSPYIQLDGDSQSNGQETITIHRPEELRYVLFAAYSAVGNGIGSFYSMKARAVVDNHQGQQAVSSLYEKNDFAYWVAIAHIDFTSSSEMKVSHVERYSRKHVERSPVLYADGSFKMNIGEEEFKD